jgi:hypothetical protein
MRVVIALLAGVGLAGCQSLPPAVIQIGTELAVEEACSLARAKLGQSNTRAVQAASRALVVLCDDPTATAGVLLQAARNFRRVQN